MGKFYHDQLVEFITDYGVNPTNIHKPRPQATISIAAFWPFLFCSVWKLGHFTFEEESTPCRFLFINPFCMYVEDWRFEEDSDDDDDWDLNDDE